MPITAKGMLLTSMDIDPAHEPDFNRWYDREHIAERVSIDGFVEARRYVAHAASPKYLSLYSTATFETLDSAAYRTALANQTEWSKQNIARFRNMIRAVARITMSRGQGRGAVLGLVRLRPIDTGKLHALVAARLDPDRLNGGISMHLLESDPNLSKSLTDDAPNPGAADWFVLIDATSVEAAAAAIALRFDPLDLAGAGTIISSGIYRLMWDLAKSDL